MGRSRLVLGNITCTTQTFTGGRPDCLAPQLGGTNRLQAIAKTVFLHRINALADRGKTIPQGMDFYSIKIKQYSFLCLLSMKVLGSFSE